MTSTRTPAKSANIWLPVIALLLAILIPYSYAAMTGTADPEVSGIRAMHSAAESIYCEEGWTNVSTILAVEAAVLAAVVLLSFIVPPRFRGPLSGFKEYGGYLLALFALIAIPFFVAQRGEGTSVCTRGNAYFWESILIEVFILAILAISYNLMFGFAGVVSFGHALFFGMGAYSVGLLMLHLTWPWWAAIVTALLISVVLALIKGFVGLRIKGLYFALFTLAFAEVFFTLAGNRILVDITGAEDGFTFDVPDWLNLTKNRFLLYYVALLILVAAFVFVRRLINSPTGRVLHALRDNEERAQMLGYNTFHFKLIAIIGAGVLAGLAGVMRGIAFKGASPNLLGLDFTINPLLMVIIGGLGTFAGPVVGAFGLRLTEQFLRDTIITVGSTEINIGERWALILGVVFILSVIVFPQGIVGTWQLRSRDVKKGRDYLIGLLTGRGQDSTEDT